MRIWVGAFEWRIDPGFTGWYLPAGVQHALDLRPLAAQAQAGGAAQARALFLTSDAVTLPNATQIASDPDETLAGQRLTRIRTALGLDSSSSVQLSDLLFEALTAQGDDTGARVCPNLMPGRDGRLDLRVGAIARSSVLDFASPTWTVVQRQYFRAYRQMYQESQAGMRPPGHYRRVLMSWIEQFGLRDTDFARFVPGDLPQEGPLPHETTITESFNKADSTTLGPDLSWTEYTDFGSTANTFDVFSNQICAQASPPSGAHARADSDVSSSNHTATLSITACGASGNKQMGVCVRCATASGDAYAYRLISHFAQVDVIKAVSGTVTEIGSLVNVTIGLPQSIVMDVNGSTLTGTYGGTPTHSFSDTAITSGTRGGVYGFSNIAVDRDALGDSWQLADIGGAAASPFFTRLGAQRA